MLKSFSEKPSSPQKLKICSFLGLSISTGISEASSIGKWSGGSGELIYPEK